VSTTVPRRPGLLGQHCHQECWTPLADERIVAGTRWAVAIAAVSDRMGKNRRKRKPTLMNAACGISFGPPATPAPVSSLRHESDCAVPGEVLIEVLVWATAELHCAGKLDESHRLPLPFHCISPARVHSLSPPITGIPPIIFPVRRTSHLSLSCISRAISRDTEYPISILVVCIYQANLPRSAAHIFPHIS